MRPETSATSGLSADAQRVLAWFKENYWGGRPPVYSVGEVARGLYGRTDGPAPGTTFDPSQYSRLREALTELQIRGLVEQGRLPQGDFGYQMVAPAR
jgi:hypothetical protein